MRGGTFWSGNRLVLTGSLAIRPASGVSLSLDLERNDVKLAEGGFETHLVRLGAAWHASPQISWSATAQYDDVTDVVGLNAMFRWILRPGSDLFVVYNHNWLSRDGSRGWPGLETLARTGTTKINYTHRF